MDTVDDTEGTRQSDGDSDIDVASSLSSGGADNLAFGSELSEDSAAFSGPLSPVPRKRSRIGNEAEMRIPFEGWSARSGARRADDDGDDVVPTAAEQGRPRIPTDAEFRQFMDGVQARSDAREREWAAAEAGRDARRKGTAIADGTSRPPLGRPEPPNRRAGTLALLAGAAPVRVAPGAQAERRKGLNDGDDAEDAAAWADPTSRAAELQKFLDEFVGSRKRQADVPIDTRPLIVGMAKTGTRGNGATPNPGPAKTGTRGNGATPNPGPKQARFGAGSLFTPPTTGRTGAGVRRATDGRTPQTPTVQRRRGVTGAKKTTAAGEKGTSRAKKSVRRGDNNPRKQIRKQTAKKTGTRPRARSGVPGDDSSSSSSSSDDEDDIPFVDGDGNLAGALVPPLETPVGRRNLHRFCMSVLRSNVFQFTKGRKSAFEIPRLMTDRDSSASVLCERCRRLNAQCLTACRAMLGDAWDMVTLLLTAETFFVDRPAARNAVDPPPSRALLVSLVMASWEMLAAFVSADRAYRKAHNLTTDPRHQRRPNELLLLPILEARSAQIKSLLSSRLAMGDPRAAQFGTPAWQSLTLLRLEDGDPGHEIWSRHRDRYVKVLRDARRSWSMEPGVVTPRDRLCEIPFVGPYGGQL